ncbi:PIG-L family deacetylase [Actinocorallia populi]|uniref:PIG-L family deacetylase n=1 Tax=Actinocorallia populi TaxID=2079200 RepID=UPI000D095DDE|nr:PIG-L family deacetylase [Actinocorallia populi]
MLTLMAVHAHPDDEVISTGGVLAKAAAAGIRTVLVTCTNGEQGDAPGGVKPGEPGHDPAAVRALRLGELEKSAELLGIEHVELLGYADSGMDGWEANQAADSFTNVDFDAATGRLAELMEKYRPQVVVTYDENGGYGHPDHIQAHRIAVAATEKTGIPDKLYYTAVPQSGLQVMFDYLKSSGLAEEWGMTEPMDFGVSDDVITTTVDVEQYAEAKVKALQAHASQSDSIFLLMLPEDAKPLVFGSESFIRVRGDGPDKEDDLFAGLS